MERISPNRLRWYNNSKIFTNKCFLVWDKNRLMRNRIRKNKNT